MILILQLILGCSGSGKTFTIRDIIKNETRFQSNKIILIVPEQSTFENEKEILKILGEYRCRTVNVLSFTRLADFVFRKLGKRKGRRLSDGGRSMLMSMAIDRAGPEISLYKRNSDRMDIVDIMTDSLREFKMCNINTEELVQISDSVKENTLKKKLNEISFILNEYDSMIKSTFADPLDDLSVLCSLLRQNNIFSGYNIFFDSFTGFTVTQLQVMKMLFNQAENIYISFSTDESYELNDNFGLFSPVNSQIKEILNIAKEERIKVLNPIILNEPKRFVSDEIKKIEKYIFRQNKQRIKGDTSDLIIYNASDIYDECDFVARTIRKLVLKGSYKYGDFAIISRDISGYADIIEATFPKYKISYFMDNPEPIVNKALIGLCFAALDIIISGYSQEDIFRYLKTGLAGLTADEIAVVENYVLLWGIKGNSWFDEFILHPRGFHGTFKDQDIEYLKLLNSLRERIITPIRKFQENILRATGDKISSSLYKLIEDVNVRENIKEMCSKLQESGKVKLAEEHARLWEIFVEALEQTAVVLKGVDISVKRYKELFKVAVCEADIAFIPQGLDQVTIGVADRIRLSDSKVVFIIGAVDGEFPRTPVQSGAFCDMERRKLISAGLNMYESLEGLYIRERFLAYTSVTSASEKLYISWPSSNRSGSGRQPSEIVKEIKKIFPDVKILDGYALPPEELIWSEESAFDLCARNWKSESKIFTCLKKYFIDNPNYSQRIKAIERAANGRPLNFENPSKALSLFGDKLRFSASQIEKYYLCRFQFFCIYGLRAKERKPAKFDAIEYGSLIHFLFEAMMSKKSLEELKCADEALIQKWINELMDKYVCDKMGGWNNKAPRFKYLFKRLSQTSLFLVKRLIDEFSQSEFKPVGYEVNISHSGEVNPLRLKIPSGGTVEIEGKIDRADIMQKDGEKYIRIVDYKTGNKEFKLSDVLYGLNMQMIVYMCSLQKSSVQKYRSSIPAGILYMPSIKPFIDAERNDNPSDIKLKAQKKVCMNGLVLDDPSIISGMEKEVKGVFIPVSGLKNGEVKKTDTLANLSQIGTIMRYAEKMIVEMAEGLKKGEVSAYPLSEKRACDWCAYGCVCGYGDNGPIRPVKDFDKEDAIRIMLEKESEQDV